MAPGLSARVIMNYRLWQDHSQLNPKILNTVFILDGKPESLSNYAAEMHFFCASFLGPQERPLKVGGLSGGRPQTGRERPNLRGRNLDAKSPTKTPEEHTEVETCSRTNFANRAPNIALPSLIGDQKALKNAFLFFAFPLSCCCSWIAWQNVAKTFYCCAPPHASREMAIARDAGCKPHSALVLQLFAKASCPLLCRLRSSAAPPCLFFFESRGCADFQRVAPARRSVVIFR